MSIKRKGTLAVASLVTALLAGGCSTPGSSESQRPVAPNTNPDAVQFPQKSSATLKEGTFANVDNLRQMIPGLTKTQVYDLLGAPHFREGLFGVRQWDYIFNFRTGKGNEYMVCQYQIKFNQDMKTETGAWDKRECADVVYPRPAPVVAPPPPPPPPPPPAPPPPAPPRKVTLAADALFAFGKSDIGSISPEGRRKLDELSRELRSVEVERVRVIGHADRIGDVASNDKLSQDRASTVVSYLVRAGLASSLVTSEGRGSREPEVQCAQTNRAALIACLAPNRRVEIEINARVEPQR